MQGEELVKCSVIHARLKSRDDLVFRIWIRLHVVDEGKYQRPGNNQINLCFSHLRKQQ